MSCVDCGGVTIPGKRVCPDHILTNRSLLQDLEAIEADDITEETGTVPAEWVGLRRMDLKAWYGIMPKVYRLMEQ